MKNTNVTTPIHDRMERYLIPVSETFCGGTYEILIGTGATGWQTARRNGRTWLTPKGVFTAYLPSVSEVRAPEVHVWNAVQELVACRRRAADNGWSPEKLEEVLSNNALFAADELVSGFTTINLCRAVAVRQRFTSVLLEDSLVIFTSPDGPDSNVAHAPDDETDDEAALEDGMAESVSAVLRQYRFNARALTGDAALDWARADIAREASHLVPPDADGERTPAWQRVHDEIRQRFNRFVLHLDDSEPLPDGAYEVRIRGWSGNWVPARIEREGRTWKLPIGRVSAANINNMVAAVRPAA